MIKKKIETESNPTKWANKEEKAVEGNCKSGQRYSERTEGVGISNCKTGGSLD